MRLTTTGLGIGTTNPTEKLHVNGTICIDPGTANTVSGDQNSQTYIKFNPGISANDYVALRMIGGNNTIKLSFDFHDDNYETGFYIRDVHSTQNPDNVYTRFCVERGGNVGIGIDNPAFKCHISGSSGSLNAVLYAYHHSGGQWYHHNQTWNTTGQAIGLRVDEGIIAQRIYLMSDERIKKDIVDIADDEALVQLRQLKPKKYKYKDVLRYGEDEVHGFIAQEVSSIIPSSCTLVDDYIPNIQLSANISSIETDSCILITQADHQLQANDIISCRDSKNNSINDITVVEIIDSKTIKINKTFPAEWTIFIDEDGFQEENVIFIYGKKVNDFHNLNKDTIWTIATAALQEVDRQLQAEKVKVATLETENTDFKNKVENLETKMSSLEEELATIKTHLGL